MMLVHIIAPLLYSVLFFFFFQNTWAYMYFVIGIFLGFGIFFLDRIFHVFFTDPAHEFSQIVKTEWKQRKYIQALQLLLTGRELQEKLITRSSLFLIAYLATALFMLTSSGSFVGMGMVLGIGLHFCIDFTRYQKDSEKFHRHFLWQLKRRLSDQELRMLVASSWGVLLLLTLMMFV